MTKLNNYLDRQLVTSNIYQMLKQEIYDQKLVPAQKLKIGALSKILNCSIVPVREALARLHAEKLVEFTPYHGYIISPLLDKKAFQNLFACDEYWKSKQSNWLFTILQSIKKRLDINFHYADDPCYEKFKTFTNADHKFHELIITSGGNNFLAECWASINVHLHLSRLYLLKGSVDAVEGQTEHCEIFELEKESVSGAINALENHLLKSYNRLLVVFKE